MILVLDHFISTGNATGILTDIPLVTPIMKIFSNLPILGQIIQLRQFLPGEDPVLHLFMVAPGLLFAVFVRNFSFIYSKAHKDSVTELMKEDLVLLLIYFNGIFTILYVGGLIIVLTLF